MISVYWMKDMNDKEMSLQSEQRAHHNHSVSGKCEVNKSIFQHTQQSAAATLLLRMFRIIWGKFVACSSNSNCIALQYKSQLWADVLYFNISLIPAASFFLLKLLVWGVAALRWQKVLSYFFFLSFTVFTWSTSRFQSQNSTFPLTYIYFFCVCVCVPVPTANLQLRFMTLLMCFNVAGWENNLEITKQ